jgi:hypothetical protein
MYKSIYSERMTQPNFSTLEEGLCCDRIGGCDIFTTPALILTIRPMEIHSSTVWLSSFSCLFAPPPNSPHRTTVLLSGLIRETYVYTLKDWNIDGAGKLLFPITTARSSSTHSVNDVEWWAVWEASWYPNVLVWLSALLFAIDTVSLHIQ